MTTCNVERIKCFNINNPYEIIFALIYLIDCGDNIVWGSNIAECVYGIAVQLLPWKTKDGVSAAKTKEGYKSVYSDVKDENQLSELDETCYDENLDLEDEYSLKYSESFLKYHEMNEGDLKSYNLSQIIYSNSYVVPPRCYDNNNVSVQRFIKSGFTKEQALILRNYKAFADSSKEKYGFDKVWKTKSIINEQHSDSSNVPSSNELLKILSLKNKEIEELKILLHNAKKQADNLTKQIEKSNEAAVSDNQELIELRNLIYNIQNISDNEEIVPDISFSFPYRTKARVIAFGGHASWLKVIAKLLPNVRFIEPDVDPDINIIRNADVVWLQTNAMPHTLYYKIIEIIRVRRIPVKYFAYASAEKCALQLAEYDDKFDGQ